MNFTLRFGYCTSAMCFQTTALFIDSATLVIAVVSSRHSKSYYSPTPSYGCICCPENNQAVSRKLPVITKSKTKSRNKAKSLSLTSPYPLLILDTPKRPLSMLHLNLVLQSPNPTSKCTYLQRTPSLITPHLYPRWYSIYAPDRLGRVDQVVGFRVLKPPHLP